MLGRFLIEHLIKKNAQTSSYFRFFLKKIKRIETREILWLDDLHDEKILTFKSNQNDINFKPEIYELNQTVDFKINIPEINLYQFNDVIINTHSSHLITTNSAIFERIKDANIQYCNYATGIIKWHNHEITVFRHNKKKENIQNAIFLGGNGVFNYYHWLIEVSPKILLLTQELLEEHKIEYLILDQRVEKIPSFQKILDLYLKEKNIQVKIKYLDHRVDLHVNTLFYINNECNIVFNSKTVLSSPDFSIISRAQVKEIREVILKSNVYQTKEFPKKIFLARKENAARSYNQEEILNYFINQGFTPLYLEDYDFYEQVSIFNNAEFIIGPSGAAWSNIIFCSPKCKAISWVSTHFSDFSIFSTLAKLNHCDLKFILTSSDDPSDIHSSYHLSLNDVKNLYEKFIS